MLEKAGELLAGLERLAFLVKIRAAPAEPKRLAGRAEAVTDTIS